jgi:starch-binding outer membrane protein, SusD/RagB family
MKIILYILIPVLLIILSCEKLMHSQEQTIRRISSYEELVSATDGLYGLLTAHFNNYYNNINLKGDDLNTLQSNIGDSCLTLMSNLEDYNSWAELYSTISSANNIITQFNNISSIDNAKANVVAEAYFLRAYCYFRLLRLYGQVPLIDNIDVAYNVPAASFDEIYKFIEKDLKTAINFLPKTNNDARIPFVTVHSGVAKAILAEVYLSWAGYPAKENSKYSLAAGMAKEVIDSSDFFGFQLMDDLAYVWDSSHFYNNESVFSIFYSIKWNYFDLTDKGCYYGSVSLQNHEVKHFLEFQFNPRLALNFPKVETNFYNNFPASYRKDISFYTYKFNWLYYKNIDEPVGYFSYYNTINICDKIGYRKFFYNATLFSKDTTNDYYSNTFYFLGTPRVYIYRYAHTLLTYAEAKARSGVLDVAAYKAVNMIRRRAYHENIFSNSVHDLQPGLSPETFADSVVWERAWEFCGEPEGRWFDLLRLEKIDDLPNIRDPKEGGPPEYPISKDDYFFTKPSE